jgi:hypothetical protein
LCAHTWRTSTRGAGAGICRAVASPHGGAGIIRAVGSPHCGAAELHGKAGSGPRGEGVVSIVEEQSDGVEGAEEPASVTSGDTGLDRERSLIGGGTGAATYAAVVGEPWFLFRAGACAFVYDSRCRAAACPHVASAIIIISCCRDTGGSAAYGADGSIEKADIVPYGGAPLSDEEEPDGVEGAGGEPMSMASAGMGL